MRTDLAAAASAVVAAAWASILVWHGPSPAGSPGHYADLVYALRALREGHGLLWNPLQNCGQPFLATTSAGLLYPPHLLFLVVDIVTGLRLLTAFHLAVGTVGLHLLARQLGLRPPAALAGAIAFGLGWAATALSASPSPALVACAWMPVALLLTERLLARPTIWSGVGLGSVLTLQLLAAAPALLLWTALLVILRVLWAFATTRVEAPARILAALGVAALVPPLLGAAQLLPLLVAASSSVRGGFLAPDRLSPLHASSVVPAVVVVLAAACAPLAARRGGGPLLVWFYGAASALFLALHSLLLALPLLGWMSPDAPQAEPFRVLWGAGCTLGVVVAFGVDAVWPAGARRERRARALVALGAVGLAVLTAFALSREPWPNPEALAARQPAFDMLRERVLPKWRIYPAGSDMRDDELMRASAAAFGVPSVGGDSRWTTRRYAELLARMQQDDPLPGAPEPPPEPTPVPRNRSLLDLLATRFFLIDYTRPGFQHLLRQKPPFVVTALERSSMVLENPRSLPRAFFVPRAEVVADSKALLERLASPEHDARRVVLLDEPPGDGFIGTEGATGRVEIVSDRSERLELRVSAGKGGFLVVTDQHAAGWYAELNGIRWFVLRANHAFRAVRVPPGHSTVVLAYRPRAVLWGSLLSAVTLLALAVAGTIRIDLRRRRRATAPAAPGWRPGLWTADDMLLGTAVLFCAGLAAMLALRAAFPCDFLLWAESPFMTDMLKLASHRPLPGDPGDLNGFVYAPGLAYLTYAVLAPFGVALDIRWARLVSVALGLGAAACAAAITTTVMPRPPLPAALRHGGVLGVAVAALLVLGNLTGDVPHPDNLHALHVTATMLLCCLALRRGSFACALAAVAVAGLGGLCKQPAALTVVGALVALLGGHAWGAGRALALVGVGLAVAGAALGALLGPTSARLFALEIPAAHILQPEKLWLLADAFGDGHRLLLLALAPWGVAWLWHSGERFGRQYLLAWAALGVTAVLPALSAFLKFMGAENNLLGLSLWLFLVAWPVLASGGAGESMVAAVARRSVALLLVLSLVPMKSIPAGDAHRYCQELIDRIGEDVRAGRRVLLAHGTTPLIRNGVLEVPRDRANTMMEIVMARRPDLLAPMRARLAASAYDRVYAMKWREYMEPGLGRHYRQVGTIAKVTQPALVASFPIDWLVWNAYHLLDEVKIYAPMAPPPPEPPSRAP